MILEPRKIKSATVFTVSPSIRHEVMGLQPRGSVASSGCTTLEEAATVWPARCPDGEYGDEAGEQRWSKTFKRVEGYNKESEFHSEIIRDFYARKQNYLICIL